MTLWPKKMHYHKKFAYKRLSNSENIIWTMKPWTFAVTLTLTTAILSFHKTLWLMMMYHQTKCGCKRISTSDEIIHSHIFIIWTITVTLTLKTANKSFHVTLQLMIWWSLNIHTGNERFSGSDDIGWTNTHWHIEPLLWPWPQRKQIRHILTIKLWVND